MTEDEEKKSVYIYNSWEERKAIRKEKERKLRLF